jgi:DNA transformation protein and related proteins
MVASAAFGALLCDELAALGEIGLRPMFGKTGVFCDGVMFAKVADDGELYLRVDGQNADAFAEAARFPPLGYVKQGQPSTCRSGGPPTGLFDDYDELVAWSRQALAAAQRVASTRRRTRPNE